MDVQRNYCILDINTLTVFFLNLTTGILAFQLQSNFADH